MGGGALVSTSVMSADESRSCSAFIESCCDMNSGAQADAGAAIGAAVRSSSSSDMRVGSSMEMTRGLTAGPGSACERYGAFGPTTGRAAGAMGGGRGATGSSDGRDRASA